MIPATGTYAVYSSPKGTTLGMAESLGGHLKRNGAGGRIVELPADTIKEEWAPTVERLQPKVKAS